MIHTDLCIASILMVMLLLITMHDCTPGLEIY